MSKTALITGITGQDGAYLAAFLLAKGYDVHGIVRPSSTPSLWRLNALLGNHVQDITLHNGDMLDALSLQRVINLVQPDEVYNLAAQSYVHVSFDQPEYTGNVDALGTMRLLESLRISQAADDLRLYQASTSELFGKVAQTPQNEQTPFHPRSPYGVAKIYAYWAVRNYREAYDMHASNGILFNHESPLRGEDFVSRKITRGVAAIRKGEAEVITLGNLDAQRDWGHARDYVRGMWQMLQQDAPDDYVMATGETRSVRAFVEAAFAHIDVKIEWRGEGVNEQGLDAKTGALRVQVSDQYMRPAEVDILRGDASKAKAQLGWEPSTAFDRLVEEMMAYDLSGELLEGA